MSIFRSLPAFRPRVRAATWSGWSPMAKITSPRCNVSPGGFSRSAPCSAAAGQQRRAAVADGGGQVGVRRRPVSSGGCRTQAPRRRCCPQMGAGGTARRHEHLTRARGGPATHVLLHREQRDPAHEQHPRGLVEGAPVQLGPHQRAVHLLPGAAVVLAEPREGAVAGGGAAEDARVFIHGLAARLEVQKRHGGGDAEAEAEAAGVWGVE